MPNPDGTLNYDEISNLLKGNAASDTQTASGDDFTDMLTPGTDLGDDDSASAVATNSDDQTATDETPGGEVETPETGTEEDDSTDSTDESEELTVLRAQLAAMQAQIEAMSKAPVKEPEAPKEPQIPDYAFNIPDQLATLMNSEDPRERVQAMSIAMTGVARAVHAQLQAEYKEELNRFAQTMPQSTMQMVNQHQTSQAIQQDFYGTYPALNNQALYGAVAMITQEVVKEGKHSGWSPKMRDEIARRVYKTLNWEYKNPSAATNTQRQSTQQTQARRGGPKTTSASATRGATPPQHDQFSELLQP